MDKKIKLLIAGLLFNFCIFSCSKSPIRHPIIKTNNNAGLEHIMRHADEFVMKGISTDKISDFIIYAIKNGKIVGIQRARPIYEVIYEGKLQRIAITISDNGFIVGANPKSIP